MRRSLAPLVVVSLFAAVQLSGQEFTREDILQLQKSVYSLQARVAALESAMTAVQTKLAAPPATVGFTQVAPGQYLFDTGSAGPTTLTIKAGEINLEAYRGLSTKSGWSTEIASGLHLLLKASGNANLETSMAFDLKATNATLLASTMMAIKGGSLQLNNGVRPALGFGTQVICPAGQGGGLAVVTPSQMSVLIP